MRVGYICTGERYRVLVNGVKAEERRVAEIQDDENEPGDNTREGVGGMCNRDDKTICSPGKV